MQAGRFRHLHTIRGASLKHPLVEVPNLRYLEMMTGQVPAALPRWEPLPNLEWLEVTSPTEKAGLAVFQSPIFRSAKHLSYIHIGNYEPAQLASLPNLQSLTILGCQREDPFDLQAVPKLRFLEMEGCRFSSISDLSQLIALRIR